MEKNKEKGFELTEEEVEIDYQDLLNIVASNLQKLRKNEHMNQAEMAREIKTLQSTYSMLENGIRDIRPLSLYYLAAKLGVNLNWIFGLSKIMYQKESIEFHDKNIRKKMLTPKRARK